MTTATLRPAPAICALCDCASHELIAQQCTMPECPLRQARNLQACELVGR